MAFIKVQKLVRNEDGSVKLGSASTLTTECDRSYKGLSRRRIQEKLGEGGISRCCSGNRNVP